MKSIRKMQLVLGLATIFLVATSLGATEVAGSFTLPSETYWQTAVLPAGTYTFTLDQLMGGQKFIAIRRGTMGVAMILLQSSSQVNASDVSSMTITEQRVRSLHLAPVGITYYFLPHGNERRWGVTAHRAAVPGMSVVPVSTK